MKNDKFTEIKILRYYIIRGVGVKFTNGDEVEALIITTISNKWTTMKKICEKCKDSIKRKKICILNYYVSTHAAMHRHITLLAPVKQNQLSMS